MTRILPLIPLMLWLAWADQSGHAATSRAATHRAVVPDVFAMLPLLCVILCIVATMALWARIILARAANDFGPLPTRGFRHAMTIARAGVVVWFGYCLYWLGFGQFVDDLLAPIAHLNIRLPGLCFAIWPVLLGWFGLWWAAYPIERATREGNLLAELDAGLTPRAPPDLRETLLGNFRMQVLFMLAPVIAIVTLRDLTSLGLYAFGQRLTGTGETVLFVLSTFLIFVASPELLVRVLRAKPLEPSPLRSRLEGLAQQLNLKYRDILIWHTSHGIGNAAVMGLVPRFRYVLLTDLLIETLDDAQIEAVFAHEVGHVKHRHLLWYKVFFAIFLLVLAGPGTLIYQTLRDRQWLTESAADFVVMFGLLGLFLLLFGMLARLFEKQADVFAARSIQSLRMPELALAGGPLATPVGSIGAESFVSALRRVAEINHMPSTRPRRRGGRMIASARHLLDVASNFLHPSIPDRVDHLRDIAIDANRTARFDQKVVLVMLGMLLSLTMLAAWVGIEYLRSA